MKVNMSLTESDVNGVLGALALQIAETTDPETKRARAALYDRFVVAQSLARAGRAVQLATSGT